MPSIRLVPSLLTMGFCCSTVRSRSPCSQNSAATSRATCNRQTPTPSRHQCPALTLLPLSLHLGFQLSENEPHSSPATCCLPWRGPNVLSMSWRRSLEQRRLPLELLSWYGVSLLSARRRPYLTLYLPGLGDG